MLEFNLNLLAKLELASPFWLAFVDVLISFLVMQLLLAKQLGLLQARFKVRLVIFAYRLRHT